MKLENACITFLVSEGGTTIELRDRNAAICFARVLVTPVQLSQMLSRLSNTDCECEVFGLDKIGKKMENKTFEFEIPSEKSGSEHSEYLFAKAVGSLIAAEMSAWIPDSYLGSKDSFFQKDSKHFARVTIRRWVTN